MTLSVLTIALSCAWSILQKLISVALTGWGTVTYPESPLLLRNGLYLVDIYGGLSQNELLVREWVNNWDACLYPSLMLVAWMEWYLTSLETDRIRYLLCLLVQCSIVQVIRSFWTLFVQCAPIMHCTNRNRSFLFKISILCKVATVGSRSSWYTPEILQYLTTGCICHPFYVFRHMMPVQGLGSFFNNKQTALTMIWNKSRQQMLSFLSGWPTVVVGV